MISLDSEEPADFRLLVNYPQALRLYNLGKEQARFSSTHHGRAGRFQFGIGGVR